MVASRWVWGLLGSAVMLSGGGAAKAQELPPTPILLAQTEQETEADLLFDEGKAAFDQGTLEGYQEAIIKFQQALPLYRTLGNQQREAYSLGWLGLIHGRLGYKQEALNYYNQELPLYQELGAQKQEATTLNNIGAVYDDLGEKQQALDFYNQALPLRRAVGDRSGEATTLNNIGAVYSALGDEQQALDYFQQALPLRRAVGDRSGEATTLHNIGLVYDDLGEKQQALDYYQQALPLSRAVGDRRGEATTLTNIGAVYDDLGEKEQALDYYQQALPLSRAVGDRRGEANTLNNIGLVYSDLGDKQQALVYYQQALPLFRAVGDSSGEATTLNNIGAVYSALGEQQQALNFYEEALPILRAVGDRRGEAGTLNNIGLVYSDLGETQQALDYFQQALPLSKAVGDRRVEATTLNNIGLVYSALGEQQQALDYFQQALPLSRAVGDRRGEAITLNNIGLVYSALGEQQQALDYFQQALPILRAVGDRRGEAGTLSNIGQVYSALGEQQQALDYFQQALPLFRAVGDRRVEATTLNNIGQVYSDLGGTQQALDYFQQALPLSRAVGDRRGEATTLSNIGQVYSDLGGTQQALDYFQQALPLSRAVGNRSGEATTLNNIGRVYDDLGEKQQALDFLQQALPLFRAVGDRNGEATTLDNIGFLFQDLEQPELAIIFYKQSVNVYESLRDDIQGLSPEIQQTYIDSIADTYRRLADLLLQQNRIIEAQRVSDLIKVQELDEYFRGVRSTRNSQQGIPELPPERQITDGIDSILNNAISVGKEYSDLLTLQQQGTLTSTQEQRRQELFEQQNQIVIEFKNFLKSDKVKTLLAQLEKSSGDSDLAESDVLNELGKLSNLSDDLAALNQNAVLLYPMILDDRVEMIITTSVSKPLRRTIPISKTELEDLIKTHRNNITNLRSDPRPTAQKLYDLLIKPLEADLAAVDAKTIIYAPDGLLRYIPLGTLYDGNQWLIEKYAVNNITATSLAELNSKPQPELNLLAGAYANVSHQFELGGEKFDFAPLPYAGIEVENIAKTIPNTTKAIDEDFKASLVSGFDAHNTIHLATHGALVLGAPEQSFILFGDGTPVTLADMEGWSFGNIDLVVLSACATGINGRLGTGVEILGLGYRMEQAGARAAIASLWIVDDGGTQVLMNEFYRLLTQEKLSKAKALQQAQIALIQNDENVAKSSEQNLGNIRNSLPWFTATGYTHPYYWSPFILIGNGL